mmetsp:Transcript_40862/g.79967  ORF Transcript_40862/g.79967 Transcript_40862/m.79967 type:complete len:98 (+) Transcript_40862:174-467(+)
MSQKSTSERQSAAGEGTFSEARAGDEIFSGADAGSGGDGVNGAIDDLYCRIVFGGKLQTVGQLRGYRLNCFRDHHMSTPEISIMMNQTGTSSDHSVV